MKKILNTLTVAALLVIFTGCNQNHNSQPSSGDTITLDFWHAMHNFHETALLELIDEFHAEFPKIRVNATFQGNYSELDTLIIASALAGTLPHIVQQTTDNITGYIEDGILLPLTDFYFHPELGLTEEQFADVVGVFKNGVAWDGELMSVPFGKSTRVIYYNADLFEEFGATAPTTWEELTGLAIMMTGENRVGLGFENNWAPEFIALTLKHGGIYIDEDTSVAMFAEPAGISAGNFIMDMVHLGYARFADEDMFQSNVFARGEVAMFIGTSSSFPFVGRAVEASENPFNWNTAVLPSFEGTSAVRFSGNDLIMMDNGMNRNEQLAVWTFMKFTMRPEITARWSTATGYTPVTYSGRSHGLFTNYLDENPQAAAGAAQFESGFMTARVAGANQVWQILSEELSNIRLGIYEVEPALVRAAGRANAVLGN